MHRPQVAGRLMESPCLDHRVGLAALPGRSRLVTTAVTTSSRLSRVEPRSGHWSPARSHVDRKVCSDRSDPFWSKPLALPARVVETIGSLPKHAVHGRGSLRLQWRSRVSIHPVGASMPGYCEDTDAPAALLTPNRVFGLSLNACAFGLA